MNFSSRPVALAPSPVLRITHQQRQPLGPTGAPHFSWYLCPQAGTYSHLVLVAQQQQLGHWVLPAVGPGPAEPTAGLWLRVPPGLAVPLPMADEASCQGAAWAVHRATGRAAAPKAMQALEALRLVLPAPPAGTGQVYWLHPVRPGSDAWLLRQARPTGCL